MHHSKAFNGPVYSHESSNLRASGGAAYYFQVRELEIVRPPAQGHLYKEIADQLGRSVETVRTDIRNIYDKLQVRSRTEAVNKVYGGGAQPVT